MGLVKFEEHLQYKDNKYIILLDDGDGTDDIEDGYCIEVNGVEDDGDIVTICSFTIPYNEFNYKIANDFLNILINDIENGKFEDTDENDYDLILKNSFK